MSPKLMLSLENVSLKIPVFAPESRSLSKSLFRAATGSNLRRNKSGVEVEALRNISLKVNVGERVGLIGHNGAGKSTFLRLISGIYKPSSGQIIASRFIYPMISRGFITSPDLSGLQAVKAHYLMINGSLKNFNRFLDDVVNFSGIGDYINFPVKGYSQGMHARLLFALLTGVNHECLALDEGIGTGDQKFVEAAEKRLDSFINNAGTLFLASHFDDLLRRFCTRGIVFDNGKIVWDGPLEQALQYYHNSH